MIFLKYGSWEAIVVIKIISDLLTEKMITICGIDNEDIEVYTYCFEIAIATAINIMVSVIISLIFMKQLEIFMFVIGFVPIRFLKGGFHAKNHFQCTSILILVELALVFIIDSDLYDIIMILCLGLSLLLVFLRTQDSNPLLSRNNKDKFDLVGKIIILSAIIVANVIAVTPYSFAFIYGIGVSCISVLLRAVQIRFE